MSTAYEAREKRATSKIEEVQCKREQVVDMPERTVQTTTEGVKVVVRENAESGLVHRTKVGGSWDR